MLSAEPTDRPSAPSEHRLRVPAQAHRREFSVSRVHGALQTHNTNHTTSD